MTLVLAVAAVLWGIGALMKTPIRLRVFMLAGLWLAVVLAQIALPHGHPLRQATGGDVRPWLALAVIVGLVLGYRLLVSRLRTKATEKSAPNASPSSGAFRPAELDRYARHIILREIGGPGQKRLKSAKVLVVGAGGLGSPALLYLAASGVGTIGVVDADTVDNSNLQRQIIHTDAHIGMPKVFSAEIGMKALNPFIEVRPYNRRLDEQSAEALISEFDLVLDGSDNFDTRYLVNRICAKLGKPLIAAAITQWEGQVSLYQPSAGGPCYECVFPVRPAPGLVPTCAEAGVASPLPGVIGSIMAMEAVKAITGAGETLRGRLMIHDALYAESRTITIKKREDCQICGSAHL